MDNHLSLFEGEVRVWAVQVRGQCLYFLVGESTGTATRLTEECEWWEEQKFNKTDQQADCVMTVTQYIKKTWQVFAMCC